MSTIDDKDPTPPGSVILPELSAVMARAMANLRPEDRETLRLSTSPDDFGPAVLQMLDGQSEKTAGRPLGAAELFALARRYLDLATLFYRESERRSLAEQEDLQRRGEPS